MPVTKVQVLKTADEKTYQLSLSINAMCDIEDKLGRSIFSVVDELSSEKTAKLATIRALYWGCFRDHHPTVTMTEAAEIMMANGGLPAAIGLLGGLIGGSPLIGAGGEA